MSKPLPDTVDNFGAVKKKIEDDPHFDTQMTPETATSQRDQLPVPTGYRVLILPRGRAAVTDGGIILDKGTIERDTISSVVGYVISKEGEWVLFGRYAGARFKIDGGELRILNDDEILARIPDPEAVDY